MLLQTMRRHVLTAETEVDLQNSGSAFLVNLWGQRHKLILGQRSFRGPYWSTFPASLLRIAISGGNVTTMKILHAVGCLESTSLQAEALKDALKHRQWAVWGFLTKEAF